MSDDHHHLRPIQLTLRRNLSHRARLSSAEDEYRHNNRHARTSSILFRTPDAEEWLVDDTSFRSLLDGGDEASERSAASSSPPSSPRGSSQKTTKRSFAWRKQQPRHSSSSSLASSHHETKHEEEGTETSLVFEGIISHRPQPTRLPVDIELTC